MSEPHAPVIELLRALIGIPSPNPPGDCQAIAHYCQHFLEQAGFTTICVAPDEQAWSVIGTLGTRSAGPTILYHAHIDTVPLGQSAVWQFEPFAGTIADGKVYGLGSVDDKAPLAAMLQAAADLSNTYASLNGQLIIVCAAGEETGGTLGTRWLVEHGYLPACDFIVVGEQTHNRVATANKGVLRATFRVRGHTAHATTPANGKNAINAMARVILALEAYQQHILDQRSHPLLGSPSINSGVIQGGVSANVVADYCTLQIDRRIVPPEAPEAVIAELQTIVEQCQRADPNCRYDLINLQVSNWFEATADNDFARQLLAISAEETGFPAEPVGYLPGSDAKHLVHVARGGMVVLGPGNYEVAHAVNEYVRIDELNATHRILYRFAEAALVNRQTGA